MSKYFQLKKGTRQRDHIPVYVFTLALEFGD